MTFRQLQKISFNHYYALTIDKFFPKLARAILRKVAALIVILAFVFSFDSLPLYFGDADGVFFLFIIIYLLLSFLEFFYRSMSGEGVRVRVNERIVKDTEKIDYALSGILFITDEIDATRAIFENQIGMEILMRAGLSAEICHDFIYSNRAPVIASTLNFDGDEVDLVSYLSVIYDADKSLQSFLA